MTDYTNVFSLHIIKKKTIIQFRLISKMNECNSIKNNSIRAIDKTDLLEQTKFRLNEISIIENYFIEEINQIKSCNQKLNKNIRMLEITIDNRYKCDLETINDPNNSQYFWINRSDLEIETKRNWQVIFDKYKDLSTQKYRRKLTPNVTF